MIQSINSLILKTIRKYPFQINLFISSDYVVTNSSMIVGKVVFNFCRTAVTSACSGHLAGYIPDIDNTTCTVLAGGDLSDDVTAVRDIYRMGDSEEG